MHLGLSGINKYSRSDCVKNKLGVKRSDITFERLCSHMSLTRTFSSKTSSGVYYNGISGLGNRNVSSTKSLLTA